MESVRFHKEIVVVPMDKVRPNPFNSNEISVLEQERIKDDIMVNGFIGGILVRPVPDGFFEIVDGEHRWKALLDLGMKEVPVIVMEHDDRRARLNSVRLNTERGTQNPRKLGAIVRSLEESGVGIVEQSAELVYSVPELEDRLDLLLLPDNMEEIIKEREEKEKDEIHLIYSFMVPMSSREVVDSAIGMMGPGLGEAFVEICRKVVEDGN